MERKRLAVLVWRELLAHCERQSNTMVDSCSQTQRMKSKNHFTPMYMLVIFDVVVIVVNFVFNHPLVVHLRYTIITAHI